MTKKHRRTLQNSAPPGYEDQPSAEICAAAGEGMLRTVADERPDLYGMDGNGIPMDRTRSQAPDGPKRWIDRFRAQKAEGPPISSGTHPSR